MIVYCDTSVLLSIVLHDSNSEKADGWYQGLKATVVISDLADLEFCAVVSRELRAKRISRGAADRALADFDALRATAERSTPDAQDFALADRLVRNDSTKLAAADALHLASAKNGGARLATFDARLAEAAKAQGVELAELS